MRPREANVQFRFASVERLTNSLSNLDPINRRGHVTLHYYALCFIAPQNSPRAHFMLHYYILRETARLIGNSVRGRKLIISAILYRKPVLRTYIVSARDRRLNPSVRPTRSGSLRPQSIQSKSERRSLSTFLKKLFQEKENFLRKPQKKIRPNPLTCRTDSAIIIKLNLFSQNNMLIWLSW